MKTISTLVEDMYEVMQEHTHVELPDKEASEFGSAVTNHLNDVLKNSTRVREPNKLWGSEVGERCNRKMYYKLKPPENAERLDPHVLFKFFYGDVIEESTLLIAKMAGHSVEQEQARVAIERDGWTISGKLDAVIDGHVIDVKSTTTRSFDKYVSQPMYDDNDPFGYRYQIGFYEHYSGYGNGEPGFLFADKTLGHIALTTNVVVPSKQEMEDKIGGMIRALSSGELPNRFYVEQPFQKSGNMKIPMPCSYCPFKIDCWEDANAGRGLQGYAYSYGPVWLTDVKREPKAPRI